MKRVFLDTNILLDVTMRREESLPESARIWADCETGKALGFISAISLNNIHYIMRKRLPKAPALDCIRCILNVFAIVPLDTAILRMAVDFPHRDFEDAIQLFSALQAKADCIVTRDSSHFPTEYLPILTPAEYRGIVQ